MLDALRDGGVAGQEARAHAIGDVAEAQIEARGLDLVGREVIGGQIPPAFASAAIMRSGRIKPVSQTLRFETIP